MRSRCKRWWELDALREHRLSARDAEAFERHVKACPECTSIAARNLHLRNLAARLRDPVIDDLALRRVRGRMLQGLATSNTHFRIGAFTIAALAVSLTTWLVVSPSFHRRQAATRGSVAPSKSPSDFAGTVLSADHAKWLRERVGGLEHVRLADGTLRVHVRRQVVGERFILDLPDGELEVRGTIFNVSVRQGSTTSVRVEEGTVALRIAGHDEQLLGAGQTWIAEPLAVATAATASPLSVEFAAAEHRRPPTKAVQVAPLVPSALLPQEDAAGKYARAIALLSGGHYAEAAKAFHDSAEARAPQAEDASFLEAVALARAGRVDAAALVAEHHLDAYPLSFHAKEASILIARSARDRGDCARATAALAMWLRDQDPTAVAAIGSCLRAATGSDAAAPRP